MIGEWWSRQSARERALILAAGVLAALVLFWLLAVSPVMAARASAERAYVAALDLYAEMAAGAAEAERLRVGAPAAQPRGSDEPLRAAASGAARDLGLEITRIQPGDSGSLAFVFDSADPQDLFRWLGDLETRYGATAASVTMRRNDSGRSVQANILVLEAQ